MLSCLRMSSSMREIIRARLAAYSARSWRRLGLARSESGASSRCHSRSCRVLVGAIGPLFSTDSIPLDLARRRGRGELADGNGRLVVEIAAQLDAGGGGDRHTTLEGLAEALRSKNDAV